MSGLGIVPRGRAAPAWSTTRWFNTPGGEALGLDALRGRLVVLHAFQMLCPGCVMHGLPQAQRVQKAFAPGEVAVVGLHTVFEHHEAMPPVALEAFLHEFRIGFAVGVDAASDDPADPVPRTMRGYGLRGTPSLLLIDRSGDLRFHAFGQVEDMVLGAVIATLLAEPA